MTKQKQTKWKGAKLTEGKETPKGTRNSYRCGGRLVCGFRNPVRTQDQKHNTYAKPGVINSLMNKM